MMTKIPLARLAKTEIGKLANLEKTLKAKIVGQDEAVEEISKAVRRQPRRHYRPQPPVGLLYIFRPHRRWQNRNRQSFGQ